MALLDASITTWGQAKTRVARVIGMGHDDDWKLIAGEYLKEALNRLEMKRTWDWLLTTDTDNATAGRTITLPADFRKPYTLHIDGDRWGLVRQRHVEAAAAEGLDLPCYSLFRANTDGLIDVFRTLTTANVYNLKYLRRITIPTTVLTDTTSDGDTLDIPSRYEPVVINWAKAAIARDKGGRVDESDRLEAAGNRLYLDCVRDEVDVPDEDNTLIPSDAIAVSWNPNSLAVLLPQFEPY